LREELNYLSFDLELEIMLQQLLFDPLSTSIDRPRKSSRLFFFVLPIPWEDKQA